MLECAALWLSPATFTRPPGIIRAVSDVRWIQSANDQATLGYCTRIPARWWPWPKLARLAVYESPDESLLLLVRRTGWFSGVEYITDADGKAIGIVSGQVVHVAMRSFRATTQARSGRFSELSGGDVAHWRPERAGTRLEFTDLLRHEPFIKMAMLGAVLSKT